MDVGCPPPTSRLFSVSLLAVLLLYAAVDMYRVCPGLMRIRILLLLAVLVIFVFYLIGKANAVHRCDTPTRQ